MSNASGAPRSGQTRPSAPGSANGVDDSTAVRPAVAATDDGPPTLAQRIMANRAQASSSTTGRGNGSPSSSNGATRTNGNRSHRTNAAGVPSSPATPARRPPNAVGAPAGPGAQSASSAGRPNTGQPFRNGQPRPAAQPATYSPVPGGAAAAQSFAAQTPPVQPGVEVNQDKPDAFSTWRKKPSPVVPESASGSAVSAGSAAAVAPAARTAPPGQRETLAAGAGAAVVTTGQAARAVPTPAPIASGASAPASSSSASAAGKSDKLVIRRTRKARLRLSRIDPWSVMKTAFMFSIAAGIVLVVAVYALWGVIQASDMFTAVNQIVQDAVGTQGDTTPFQLEQYINTPKVMGATSLIAAVDVVLVTALATLVAFLYNLSASVLGGLEVTLAED